MTVQVHPIRPWPIVTTTSKDVIAVHIFGRDRERLSWFALEVKRIGAAVVSIAQRSPVKMIVGGECMWYSII